MTTENKTNGKGVKGWIIGIASVIGALIGFGILSPGFVSSERVTEIEKDITRIDETMKHIATKEDLTPIKIALAKIEASIEGLVRHKRKEGP